MATQLKPVDVAVIGLGAAGGVAVLPLARAGLRVAAIEAGTWMDTRDFKADEIHNNVRRLGHVGIQDASARSPRFALTLLRLHASGQHPMMNAVGRHLDPLLGAKLAAEAVGFQDAL